MTNILALDLGTNLGWATNTGGLVSFGVQKFPQERFEGGGMRFIRFQKAIETILDRNIDIVVFEEVRRHLGTTAAHLYGGWLAHLTAICEKRKLPYYPVTVQTIKMHALEGIPKSEHPKGKGMNKVPTVNWAKKRGYAIKGDNDADALCLLDYAVQQYGGQKILKPWE